MLFLVVCQFEKSAGKVEIHHYRHREHGGGTEEIISNSGFEISTLCVSSVFSVPLW